MASERARAETVRLLQDLGLKEYEARCLLALTQVPSASAKEISDISEVPRTRVYDAVRVLEAQGLVEVQHANPQQFRGVGVEEATATLRQRYDDRIDTLRSYLDSLDVQEEPNEPDQVQGVWSLSGHEAIESRTLDLLQNADTEIVLLVVDEAMLSDRLYDRLRDADERDVDVIVGGVSRDITETVETELPGVEVFETELDWLVGPGADGEVAISRLLLVDRTRLLVGSYYPDGGHAEPTEQAVFADGLGNGVVVLIRRLISTGLLPAADPGD